MASWGCPGLLWWLSGRESTCNAGDAGDTGLIPGLGRSPGEGNGNPNQYPYLENPMNRRAWRVRVHRVAKNQSWKSMHNHRGYPSACKKALLIWKLHEYIEYFREIWFVRSPKNKAIFDLEMRNCWGVRQSHLQNMAETALGQPGVL